MRNSSSWRRTVRQAGMRERSGASRTYRAAMPRHALSTGLTAFSPQGFVMLMQISPRRLRKSEILLHNPHFIRRCLLPGEPTLAGNVLCEGTVGEIKSSKVGALGLRDCGSGAGLGSSLAAAPGSINGVGPVQHGFRSENDLAARCASGARCSLATLSAAHCSSRTRWLGQIRKWPPWQSLA